MIKNEIIWYCKYVFIKNIHITSLLTRSLSWSSATHCNLLDKVSLTCVKLFIKWDIVRFSFSVLACVSSVLSIWGFCVMFDNSNTVCYKNTVMNVEQINYFHLCFNIDRIYLNIADVLLHSILCILYPHVRLFQGIHRGPEIPYLTAKRCNASWQLVQAFWQIGHLGRGLEVLLYFMQVLLNMRQLQKYRSGRLSHFGQQPVAIEFINITCAVLPVP